jgi:hypothetical protein
MHLEEVHSDFAETVFRSSGFERETKRAFGRERFGGVAAVE